MKRLLVVFILIFGVSALFAQDKSAKDYKIEAADAYKAKDYQKGLSSFEKSIQLYEADGKIDTTLYYNAAICAIKVEDYEKAITYFDRSMELDYKACKAQLYKANALKKLDRNDEMETVCLDGVQKCPKYKSKFNELLFQNYLVAGLDIFNNAAKMQADITPLATSDPDKYTAEMEKVKAEFQRSLPLLEKAYELDSGDENVKKALSQAYEILDMQAKASGL
jgi:tetratricopeptide (TPR) repeat protein